MTPSLIEPHLIRRECGGWLAISGTTDPVRIGVVADTEDVTRALFRAQRARWDELLAAPFDPGSMPQPNVDICA